MLAIKTNRYAAQRIQKVPDRRWEDVTADEVKAYLGIRFYMSIMEVPGQDMYWSTDKMYGQFYVANVMKRERFEKIQQYFHVADIRANPKRGQPGHDKLAHVRPLLDKVRKNCMKKYNGHQNFSIDEAMVPFRGRLSWKQYIPAKPTKYGLKIWMRADPHNGYCQDFQVYTGKEGNRPEQGLGARVVRDLSNELQGKGHIVNCDNYFSSPALFIQLHEVGTFARGTVRTDRKGMPPASLWSDKGLKEQGSMAVAQNKELTAVKWRDKRIVNFLTTADCPLARTQVKRKKKDGSQVMVNAHKVTEQYNTYMNGINRADQLRNTYPTLRKSRKWWHYMFWFLVDVSVVNAYICMKESQHHQIKTKEGNEKQRCILSFKMALSRQLIGGLNRGVKRSASMLSPSNSISNMHMPNSAEKAARCRMCCSKGKRRETRVYCMTCDVKLCVKGCYARWHKNPQNL